MQLEIGFGFFSQGMKIALHSSLHAIDVRNTLFIFNKKKIMDSNAFFVEKLWIQQQVSVTILNYLFNIEF